MLDEMDVGTYAGQSRDPLLDRLRALCIRTHNTHSTLIDTIDDIHTLATNMRGRYVVCHVDLFHPPPPPPLELVDQTGDLFSFRFDDNSSVSTK